MDGFTRVGTVSSIAAGTARMVQVGGKEIALFNVNGTIHATANACPHQGGPLAEGTLNGTVVTCPWHNWTWDVSNGACKVNPKARLECAEVKVEGEEIFVRV